MSSKYYPYLVFIAALLRATDAPFRTMLAINLDSSLIVLIEHLINLVIIIPLLVMGWKEIKNLHRKDRGALLFIGIGWSALASMAFTYSFTLVNPSIAIILQKLQPLLVIGLSGFILLEKFTRKFRVGAWVCLVAGYFLSFPTGLPYLYDGEQYNPQFLGIVCILASVVLRWGSTVLGKFVLSKTSFPTITALRFAIASIFLLILNTWTGTIGHITSVTPHQRWYLVIIALVSGSLSLLLYYKWLQKIPASVATFAEYGFPVGAVVINYFALWQGLSRLQIAMMVVILVAIYGMQRKVQI